MKKMFSLGLMLLCCWSLSACVSLNLGLKPGNGQDKVGQAQVAIYSHYNEDNGPQIAIDKWVIKTPAGKRLELEQNRCIYFDRIRKTIFSFQFTVAELENIGRALEGQNRVIGGEQLAVIVSLVNRIAGDGSFWLVQLIISREEEDLYTSIGLGESPLAAVLQAVKEKSRLTLPIKGQDKDEKKISI